MEKKQADFSSKELQLDKIKNPSTYKSLTTYDQDLDFSIRVYTFQCSVCMLVPEEIFLEKKKTKKRGWGGRQGTGTGTGLQRLRVKHISYFLNNWDFF